MLMRMGIIGVTSIKEQEAAARAVYCVMMHMLGLLMCAWQVTLVPVFQMLFKRWETETVSSFYRV